jgi:hypothetical protein
VAVGPAAQAGTSAAAGALRAARPSHNSTSAGGSGGDGACGTVHAAVRYMQYAAPRRTLVQLQHLARHVEGHGVRVHETHQEREPPGRTRENK